MSEKILLEAGTNEMELLLFSLGDTHFGINVAKVREIISRVHTIVTPDSPPSVEGNIRLRDRIITLVNLGEHFDMIGEETASGKGLIIIIEFNSQNFGILVDKVDRIHRVKWDDIEPPSEFLTNKSAPVTGVVQFEDNTVLIADLESIMQNIFGAPFDDLEEDEAKKSAGEVKNVNILFAEDSGPIRAALVSHLKSRGYANIKECTNGKEAWDEIEKGADNGGTKYDLVITDIEMPRMDGLHLTSRIKKHNNLQNVPVIIFSSLISADNANKGEAVGADAQVAKTDRKQLLSLIDELTKK